MFNNKTEDEIDFCESYKSQILNNVKEEKSSSFGTLLKILIILLLLAIIIGLSIYGYNYFMSKKSSDADIIVPPSSIQISDEDLKVIDESSDEVEEPQKLQEVKKTEENEGDLPPVVEENKPSVEKSLNVSTIINESDIDKIANDVKVAIAQEEEKGKNQTTQKEKSIAPETVNNVTEKNLEVPVPNSPESKYLEDLAKLSEEIEKERKNK